MVAGVVVEEEEVEEEAEVVEAVSYLWDKICNEISNLQSIHVVQLYFVHRQTSLMFIYLLF